MVDTGTMFDLWPVLTVESEANSIKLNNRYFRILEFSVL